jgi:hypothetical protein
MIIFGLLLSPEMLLAGLQPVHSDHDHCNTNYRYGNVGSFIMCTCIWNFLKTSQVIPGPVLCFYVALLISREMMPCKSQ